MSWILGGTLDQIYPEDSLCTSICLPFGGPGVSIGVQWSSGGIDY